MNIRLLILSCLLMNSCQTNLKDKQDVATRSDNPKDTIIAQEQLVEQEAIKLFNDLSESELAEIRGSSKLGRTLLYFKNNTLSITSDGRLTNKILGNDNNVMSLQQYNNKIYIVEEEQIPDEVGDDMQIAHKLVYKNSFVKVYNNTELGSKDIVSARILDRDIKMVLGIKIGQTKQEFFSKIFNDINKYDFSLIDTVRNGDELGEIQQQFIFSNEILKEVIIMSDYDWIPFDLD